MGMNGEELLAAMSGCRVGGTAQNGQPVGEVFSQRCSEMATGGMSQSFGLGVVNPTADTAKARQPAAAPSAVLPS